MQLSIVDVASVFLSVNPYPREFNTLHKKKKKNTNDLGPAWQNFAGNHRIPWQKKIAFNDSDPGDTLEDKLNDLSRRAWNFKEVKGNALALEGKSCD